MSATCGATGRSRAPRARPGGASISTSCSRTSAFRAATSTARATACTGAGSSCGARRRVRSSASASRSIRTTATSAAAEKRMFEHPRLRAVICNSKMVREEIQRGFRVAPEKLHVIYNGVDLEHFHPAPARRAARRGARRARLQRARHRVRCSSARASRARGWTRRSTRGRRGRPYWLVVVGTDRDARATRASPRGSTLRSAAARTCARYYAAADCFLLPTRYDPFPNTVLEALAMGLPAIVSSRCGAAEIDRAGRERLDLPSPTTSQALARLMRGGRPRHRRAAG